MTGMALRGAESVIDGEPVAADQMGDDRVAVADLFAVVDDIGKLPARRLRGVEDVLMDERQAS